MNRELQLYHARYSPLSEQERDSYSGSLPFASDIAGDELTPELLAPLLQTYDKRLADKTIEMGELHHELTLLQRQVGVVVKENEELHNKLFALERETPDDEDWADLREHVAVLAKENQLLLEQEQAATLAADEFKQELDIVRHNFSRTSAQLQDIRVEKKVLESAVSSLQKKEKETQTQLLSTQNNLRRREEEYQALEAEYQRAGATIGPTLVSCNQEDRQRLSNQDQMFSDMAVLAGEYTSLRRFTALLFFKKAARGKRGLTRD